MKRSTIIWPLVALFGLLCLQVHAVSVSKISWDSQPQTNQLTVQFDGKVRYNAVDVLRDKGYYYIDFYGISVNYKRRLLEINDSFVRYVDAVCYPDHAVLRLVVYVKDPSYSCRLEWQEQQNRAIIHTVGNASAAAAATTTGSTALASATPLAGSPRTATLNQIGTIPTPPVGSLANEMAKASSIPEIPEPNMRPSPASTGRKKYVIIDAGHGGGNSGASSTALLGGREVQEKDLTLQYAYHLKKIIDASPNMVAFLTRSDDTPVGLEQRVKCAEEYQGDIFLSFHMNDGSGNSAARGVEFYYLNEKGTDDAASKAVENRENELGNGSASLRGETPLLKTLLTEYKKDDLKKWQYESYLVSKSLYDSFLTLPFYRNTCRGIKSANFLVLKNSCMPAVLVEVGFITNSTDLQYLINPTFQRATAVLVYNALNRYFGENDPGFKPNYISLSSTTAR